jgi:hypothetical protein
MTVEEKRKDDAEKEKIRATKKFLMVPTTGSECLCIIGWGDCQLIYSSH